MLLLPDDPILGNVPAQFFSPFPSDKSQLEPKYKALLSAAGGKDGLVTVGQQLMAQSQSSAWRDGMTMVNKARATLVGDLLTDWLPKVAWLGKGSGGRLIPQGMFATVPWPASMDPKDLLTAAASVALDIALGAVSAIPIVGQIIGAVIQLARFIVRLFRQANDPATPRTGLLLPWSEYTRDTDEDVVNNFLIKVYGSRVDWTPIWMPPLEARPWNLLTAKLNNDPDFKGQVWAPIQDNAVAFSSSGLGLLPNTMRTLGHLQRGPAGEAVPPDLQRYFQGNPVAMGWGRPVTMVGDFYPALSQVGGGLWQQVMCPGSPTMYSVDPAAVKSAWAAFFDAFFESGFAYYKKSSTSIGELLAPFICTVLTHDGGDDVRLGIPNMQRPHPAPFVTPDIFKSGPATPATRTTCLWIEEDLPHTADAWPFVAQVGTGKPRYPRQSPDVNWRSGTYVDDDGVGRAGEYFWQATKNGGAPGGPEGQFKVPKGYRCIAWPTPQELLIRYSRPDDAIVTPACDRLAELQRRCLERTLVGAYVRPDPVGDLPRYGAFANDEQLRQKCRDLREVLLKNDARYLVNLKDVDAIDPPFAARLRAAGVTNSIAQRTSALTKLRPNADMPADGEPLPPPLPPAAGVAFDDVGLAPPPAPPSGRSRLGPALLFGAAIAAYKLTR